MSPASHRVAGRFGRAAATYDAATPIQREVAARLAHRVLAAGPPADARVAEFGCGTGHLGRALAPLNAGLWIATDIAPAMAVRAGGLAAVMDAARPALKPGFDLVCSSLTLQWITDGKAAVAQWRQLVRPGGLLAVATLLDDTFSEWRSALGPAATGQAFPGEETARLWFSPGAAVDILTLTERHAGGLAFARAAKRAGIDAGMGRSLDAGTMRRALKAFEAGGASVTYKVMLAVETV